MNPQDPGGSTGLSLTSALHLAQHNEPVTALNPLDGTSSRRPLYQEAAHRPWPQVSAWSNNHWSGQRPRSRSVGTVSGGSSSGGMDANYLPYECSDPKIRWNGKKS